VGGENKMMTRKDFRQLADRIQGIGDPKARREAFEEAVKTCQASNPRFNVETFRLACRVSIPRK
jgi:hypothetical protein